MGKKRKILVGALALVLATQKYQAMQEKRSLRSLLLEKILQKTDLSKKMKPDLQKTTNAPQPYTCPKDVKSRYGVTELADYEDTFQIIPDNKTEKVIFYLHGGAYWFQPTLLHYAFLNKLAKKLKARIIMPIYPKAPIYQALAVYPMILERYLHLLETEKIQPKDLIVMGDSAGGGLAAGFLQYLRDQNRLLPDCGILFSPRLALAEATPEMKAIEPLDPFHDLEQSKVLGQHYAGQLGLKDPLVSPIYGDFADLPPLHIFSGTRDVLHPDSQKLADLGQKKHLPIYLYEYPKMLHDFVLMPLPESKAALKQVEKIIKTSRKRLNTPD